MARPADPSIGDLRRPDEEIRRREYRKSLFDRSVDCLSNGTSRHLAIGMLTGWFTGVTVVKVGRIAAFGLGGGIILLHFATELGYITVNWERVRETTNNCQVLVEMLLGFAKNHSGYTVGFIGGLFFVKPAKPPAAVTTPTADPSERPPLPPPDPPPPPKPPAETFKPNEEANIFLDKPAFIPPPKPISHSPKISPSSIPNPSPSVTTNKQVEPGYPNYSNYLYNIPGYSAFQPVSYPGIVQPNQAPLPQNEPTTDFVPFPTISTKETASEEKNNASFEEMKPADPTPLPKVDVPKPPTDFEEHFTPEIIPAVSTSEKTKLTECKMSITSLTQGSGATITIPAQVSQIPQISNNDTKKKPTERFSLKTSIPISKIDMKCVNNQPENILQNSLTKKPSSSQSFPIQKVENGPRVEIQSNIIIKKPDKTLVKEPEKKSVSPMPNPIPERKTVSPMSSMPNNSINALINAAEVINKNESQFRKPEPKPEALTDIKDTYMPQPTTTIPRPIFNPVNLEANKVNFANKPTEGYSEQKNQILFIQNKNPSNPKMLLTIQQQNPQVLLQRTNFDSKNLQAPSRLSSQTKKTKDELVNENSSSSKVVALKRLHQENCDENDFENLITENQIYGNKIVVKEKSQGTLQEQDLKNKVKIDKPMQTETKNVVLQPNFLYLSNVQFPNLMMIKNNAKVTQNNDTKPIKQTSNENKVNEVINKTSPDPSVIIQNSKTQTVAVSKEIHVLKSSNNVLQTLSNKNNKTDLVFQTTTPKVIMSPQIVYQVPMIVETDNKLNQPFINRDYPKFLTNKKEYPKQFDQTKTNDKLFIACPYQMDAKLQPKIVITNIRPKIAKVEEVSTIDLYEKRRRIRRLKYLTNRETKEQKVDTRKVPEKVDLKNVITPDKMKAEIYKEFTKTRIPTDHDSSESESDFGDEEMKEYEDIVNEYSVKKDDQAAKAEFLSNFMLATHEVRKEKEMDKQERILRRDSVAAAYIAVGRLDRLHNEDNPETLRIEKPTSMKVVDSMEKESPATMHRKQTFLNNLKLTQVSPQCRDGYEKTWQEIMKERNRRNGVTKPEEILKLPTSQNMELDPNGQLQLLTEIKKSVNENNNLIKKRLDSLSSNDDGESIKVLAEKNFSELNRLSKMADQSVKIFSGQETRKRDLNPGFDSENIQKPVIKLDQAPKYASINIPNISKIISLKTTQEQSAVTSSQATSMDEPRSCAAGVEDDGKKRDFGCQAEDFQWPGVEAMLKSFREFDAARKKEISDLHRRNTSLRVESAHITRNASRDSERARALLAERQNLAVEENNLRISIQRICAAIEVIRNS